MFCIECQKKLSKAFKKEFGSEVIITVSWEKGLGIVSIPSKGIITESDFKRVVEETNIVFNNPTKNALA